MLIVGGLLARAPACRPSAARSDVRRGRAATLLAFGAALVPILFSYGGWQSANVLAEEIREPRRTLPRALVAGTLIVLAVYVLVNVVYLATLGRDGLAATATPAADAVRRLFGPGAERWIAAAIAVSTFGFLDLTLLAPTRIYYAMARDGVFFPASRACTRASGRPTARSCCRPAGRIVLLLTGTYGDLVDSVVFADWIFFALTVVGRDAVPPPLSAGRARPRVLSSRPAIRSSRSSFSRPPPWSSRASCARIRCAPASALVLIAAGLPVYLAYAGRAQAAERRR